MSAALLPALLAASGLLLVSGAAKLRDPAPAASALRAIGLPFGRRTTAAAALCELALGAACALRPATAAGAVAVAYALFALVSWRQVRAGAGGSCGCLGRVEAPVSVVHVALNAALAAVALAGAAEPPPGVLPVLARHPLGGLVLLVAAAAATFLCAAALVLLPQALTAYRRPAA